MTHKVKNTYYLALYLTLMTEGGRGRAQNPDFRKKGVGKGLREKEMPELSYDEHRGGSVRTPQAEGTACAEAWRPDIARSYRQQRIGAHSRLWEAEGQAERDKAVAEMETLLLWERRFAGLALALVSAFQLEEPPAKGLRGAAGGLVLMPPPSGSLLGVPQTPNFPWVLSALKDPYSTPSQVSTFPEPARAGCGPSSEINIRQVLCVHVFTYESNTCSLEKFWKI